MTTELEQLLASHQAAAQDALAKGAPETALSHYFQYLQLQPADVEMRERVAELLVRLGRKPDAVQTYEQVARGHAAGGHLFKSIAIVNAIQQLEPGHTRTQEHLADAFGKHGAGATRDGVTDHQRAHTPVGPQLRLGTVTPVAVGALGALNQSSAEGNISQIVEEIPAPPALAVDPAQLPLFPLFADLDREQFVAVLQRVRLRPVQQGEVVLEERTRGTAMYMVAQGGAQVYRRRQDGSDRVLALLGEGQFFGEGAVLADGMRSASVRAVADGLLLELERADMEEVCAQHPAVRQVLDRFHRDRMLDNLMRASPLFRLFGVEEQQQIIRSFVSSGHDAGEDILHQGQAGDGFYVLLRGRCLVIHHLEKDIDRMYPELGEGDVFGEISLILGKPCTATVRAATPVVVLRLPQEAFNRLVMANTQFKRELTDLATQRRKRTADMLTAIMLGFETFT